MLLEVYCEEESVQIQPETLLSLIKSCDRQHLDETLVDESTCKIVQCYIEFQNKVRAGHLGKTGIYWMTFMDHFRMILMLIFAVKTNNQKVFHHCNGEMADLFFAYDGQNYSHYLTWFEAFVTNLELTHPGAIELMNNGVLGCIRSLIP